MNTPHRPLADKRGLIIAMGSEQGVALQCAKRSNAIGARFVVVCLDDAAAFALRPYALKTGALLLACATNDRAALAQTVALAVRHLSGLDFVVHALDCSSLDDATCSDDVRIEAYFQHMQTSCRTFTELARLCGPHMPQGAALVHLNNLHVAGTDLPPELSRAVSRVLQSIVRYLALELEPWQLRVHAMSRHMTQMPMRYGSSLSDAQSDELAYAVAEDQAPAADLADAWLEWLGDTRAADIPARTRPDHAWLHEQVRQRSRSAGPSAGH